LAGDLPEFLSILAVGTPAIGIFFDIFVSQDGLKGPTSMIHIQHIFDKKPLSLKRRDEEFVDPFTDTFPHRYGFAWRRRRDGEPQRCGLGTVPHLIAATPHQTTQPPHRYSHVSHALLGDEPVPLGSEDAPGLDILLLG
jgi:hypothetical protein